MTDNHEAELVKTVEISMAALRDHYQREAELRLELDDIQLQHSRKNNELNAITRNRGEFEQAARNALQRLVNARAGKIMP
jgi:hypothetical protein